MLKVLISDKMSPRAAEIFHDRGIDVDSKPGMKPEELAACIGDYDGLAVRSATKATADILDRATKLKVIGRAGIGVDNIDVPAATAHGVVVMNTPFGNAITTAEHAITLMFALARQIPTANASTQAGKWEKSRFMGVELTGKTLGIIGCGNIGAIVADRALGLKMKVLAYDPYLTPERATDLCIEKIELDDLFARSYFITLHTPLNDATRDLLNAEAFAKMRDGVRVINCARGGLINEADLKKAIEGGKVAGAAVDVYPQEPAHENILFGMEQIIATPHLGASTSEAQENVAIQVAEQMADYLLTGAVTNAINMPSVTAEEAVRLRPYMTLAQQLGSFAGQMTETGIEAVTIEYAGQVTELNTRPLTALALEGLLAPLMESVNMVNAPTIARERDIDITEVKHERETDYQNADPAGREDGEADPECGRHPVWRGQAPRRPGRRHRRRGRVGPVHAFRDEPGQARLHRETGWRAWQQRGEHRHLSSGSQGTERECVGIDSGGRTDRRCHAQGSARHPGSPASARAFFLGNPPRRFRQFPAGAAGISVCRGPGNRLDRSRPRAELSRAVPLGVGEMP